MGKEKSIKTKIAIVTFVLIAVLVLIAILVNAENLGFQPYLSSFINKNKVLSNTINIGIGKDIPMVISDKVVVTILSPVADTYIKNKINLEIESSDKCTLEYISQLINLSDKNPFDREDIKIPDSNFKELCKNCNYMNQTKLLEDGTHYLVARCKENKERDTFTIFYVDGKVPRVISTNPKEESFTNGNNFEVLYEEDNIVYAIIKIKELCEEPFVCQEIQTIQECNSGKTKECEFEEIDLKQFEGKTIEYQITINDIADRSSDSLKVRTKVDTIPPVINSFYISEEEGKITFEIEVLEDNLEKIEYIDNYEKNPSWKSLCISRNQKCKLTKKETDGLHSYSIRAIDTAGNMAVSASPTRI